MGLGEFHNFLILDQALTHSSYANENKANHGYYNERLEFLGDAILDLVVGEYLFLHYPHMPEGQLSKARASVVSESPLASVCMKFHMGDYLLLGKGEIATGGRTRPSMLADAFEAFQKGALAEVRGFCAIADLETIKRQDYILTPGRYVGIEEQEDDGEPFKEKMARLTSELSDLFAKSHKLEMEIKERLGAIGYEI